MLPILNSGKTNSKKYVVAFRGLNYGEGYQDGEFSECRNVSSVLYPCVTQRFGRVEAGAYTAPSSMMTKDGLVVIDGTEVKYNGAVVGTVTAGRKQMTGVGNYVVIFPDKAFYNVETGEFGSMEATRSETGLVFTDSTITCTGEAWPFHVGDAVTITGCEEHGENNKTPIVRGVSGNVLTFYENTFTAGTETVEVTVTREVPDLDYICESNYRLWGTKGNTIYGSKYADPFNFNVFDGLTGDSYYIDVGSDGEFTGCIPYSSHVCFFKENTLHKLYGSKPSNFQIVTSQVYGVQAGSERSLCTINETLFYKGVGGVYAYTGGVPELVSEAFGTRRYTDACAATDGSRYYIDMKSGEESHLLVYDVARDLWMEEDELPCVDMAFHEGKVYLLSESGTLYRIDEEADRSEVEWRVTFCPFNEVMNERKGYSKFHLRLDLSAGAWVAVDLRRNTDRRWQVAYQGHAEYAKTLSVPVLPARCDSVEVRLRGKGECVLRTFVREFFVGSDV